jgi:hypothetical protein
MTDRKERYGKTTRFWSVTVLRDLLERVNTVRKALGLTKAQVVNDALTVWLPFVAEKSREVRQEKSNATD